MLRVWNVTLVILTFFLTIFGTFMTRSGVVSVGARVRRGSRARLAVHGLHDRAPDVQLRAGDLPAAAAARAQRARLVDVARGGVPRQQLDPAVLRVLRALRDDVPDAERGDHRRAPDGRAAVLQQVDAADRAGPAAPDRHRAAAGVAEVDARQPPRLSSSGRRSAAFVTGGAFVALGFRVWASGLCFALCAFVTARSSRSSGAARACGGTTTGTDFFTALVGLVGRNKRRYGGYIVHLGIVLIFFGFAGEGFKQEQQMLLKPGEQTTIGRYTIRYDRLSVDDDGQKQMITAHMTVFQRRQADRRRCTRRSGLPQARDRAADDRGRDPAHVRRRPLHRAGGATTRARRRRVPDFVNPLVNWIWLGFGIMALGTGIALLPERSYAFALAEAARAP